MIRLANTEDFPAIEALALASFAHPSEYWPCARLNEWLQGMDQTILVDTDATALRAVVMLKAFVSVTQIACLMVAPALRRQGLAQNMIKFSAAWARGNQSTALEIEVAVDNPGAIALYASQQFEKKRIFHGLYSRGHGRADGWLMALPLAEV